MPVSLTNSKDIIPNSVYIIDANDILNIVDLTGGISKVIASIVGNPPQTLNTIQKLAEAINNGPQVYNTIVNMNKSKFPSSGIANYYTKLEVQQMFLNLIDNAPGSLDTLNELAAALGDDSNFANLGKESTRFESNYSLCRCLASYKAPLDVAYI